VKAFEERHRSELRGGSDLAEHEAVPNLVKLEVRLQKLRWYAHVVVDDDDQLRVRRTNARISRDGMACVRLLDQPQLERPATPRELLACRR
jgi:hypothetical protein